MHCVGRARRKQARIELPFIPLPAREILVVVPGFSWLARFALPCFVAIFHILVTVHTRWPQLRQPRSVDRSRVCIDGGKVRRTPDRSIRRSPLTWRRHWHARFGFQRFLKLLLLHQANTLHVRLMRGGNQRRRRRQHVGIRGTEIGIVGKNRTGCWRDAIRAIPASSLAKSDVLPWRRGISSSACFGLARSIATNPTMRRNRAITASMRYSGRLLTRRPPPVCAWTGRCGQRQCLAHGAIP